MLFAYFKRVLALGRLWFRGPHSANDEFLSAATAQIPLQIGEDLSCTAEIANRLTRKGFKSGFVPVFCGSKAGSELSFSALRIDLPPTTLTVWKRGC